MFPNPHGTASTPPSTSAKLSSRLPRLWRCPLAVNFPFLQPPLVAGCRGTHFFPLPPVEVILLVLIRSPMYFCKNLLLLSSLSCSSLTASMRLNMVSRDSWSALACLFPQVLSVSVFFAVPIPQKSPFSRFVAWVWGTNLFSSSLASLPSS